MELRRTETGFALYKEKEASAIAPCTPPHRARPLPPLPSTRHGGARAMAPTC